MKTQTLLVTFLVVLLMVATQTEAGIADILKGLLGKRGLLDGLLGKRGLLFGKRGPLFGKRALTNQDFLDFAYDPSLSAADMDALEMLFEDY
uniref:Peptide Ctry2146 n=1 Tax=Chaerilus tryznai TaxID=1464547 RepID=NDB4S_CHATY|nr:RecName: Full=Peptide Ctry2146; Flags: Precursor [Chaerilus tryznai]